MYVCKSHIFSVVKYDSRDQHENDIQIYAYFEVPFKGTIRRSAVNKVQSLLSIVEKILSQVSY